MAKTVNTVSIDKLPSPATGGRKNVERQDAYDNIVRALANKTDEALIIECDEGETQKGVGLALVYAGQRQGMELRAWAIGDNQVAVRHASTAEKARREAARKASRNGAAASEATDATPTRGDAPERATRPAQAATAAAGRSR